MRKSSYDVITFFTITCVHDPEVAAGHAGSRNSYVCERTTAKYYNEGKELVDELRIKGELCKWVVK